MATRENNTLTVAGSGASQVKVLAVNGLEAGCYDGSYGVALAVRLGMKKVLPAKWSAPRLQIGPPGYVNLLPYRRRKGI